ncbi:MAG: SprB repeat-containing protein, partial [Cyclobacteriaceae bacterium]|nr:SprB repeat-containing protein [Cyclobacteriaceae bacterium]
MSVIKRIALLTFFLGLSSAFISTSVKAQCPDFINSVLFSQDACFNEDNGIISVKLSAGNPPYDVSNFELRIRIGFITSPVIPGGEQVFNGDSIVYTGLQPNSDFGIPGLEYVVWFSDASCAGGATWEIGPFTINESTEVNSNPTVTPSCSGNDGEILLSTSGGTPVYSYAWTGPVAIGDTNNPTNLVPGSYSVTITDAIGCTKDTTIVIDPSPIGGALSPASTSHCGPTNSGTLSLSGHVGNIVRWETSTDGFATKSDIANTLDTYSYTNLSVATHSFRAVIDNVTCPEVFSTVATVTVNPLPLDAT